MSLRELASHASGLPEFTASEVIGQDIWFGLLHADGARQDAAETMTDVLGQHLEARGRFSYSTAGIALLAHLLAKRAGTTCQQLLTQRILKPLSLTDTHLPSPGQTYPRGGARASWAGVAPSHGHWTDWRQAAACGLPARTSPAGCA